MDCMLDLSKRKSIVKSYSNVLASVLKTFSKDDISKIFFSFKEKICDVQNLQNLTINPCNVAEYKKFISGLQLSVDTDDDLQRFLYVLLRRRYLHLLPQILKKTEDLMKKDLSLCKLVVSSKTELSNSIKQDIENMVKKSSTAKNIDINYCIKDNLDENSIELSSSGKICVINIDNIINEVLRI